MIIISVINLFLRRLGELKYSGIILIRWGQCSWIDQILMVRGHVISCVTGLYLMQDNSFIC